MYTVVKVLSKAGDQLPLIPFKEVVGKGNKFAPEQIGAIALKVGIVLLELTTIVNEVDETQLVELGVKR